MIDQPLVFKPLYQERVWGGRVLESRFNRSLPEEEVPFGESWEVVDREKEQSVVRDGTFAGKTLEELWQGHRQDIFGSDLPESDRFPLLVKILDARDRLSVQVHPPAEIAPKFDGEPKTEMWYIAHADPGAKLYVGLKKGVSREAFDKSIQDGSVEDLVHAIPVQTGESIFIPSGRLHAIGAGLVIYEIQQNSDTTYRVFDWNRLGLDGKPRQLHVSESLDCIDFADWEPAMDQAQGETLATCPHFHVEKWDIASQESRDGAAEDQFSIIAVVDGEVTCGGHTFKEGEFFVIPAKAAPEARRLQSANGGGCQVLQTTLPK